MKLVQFFPNEIIMSPDTGVDAIYVVKSGCLQVSSNGHKETYEVWPSMNFGLNEMLNQVKSGVQIIATRSSSVLKIDVEEICDGVEDVSEELQSALAGVHLAIKNRIVRKH